MLANEQMAHTMEHRATLLHGRLGWYEPHVGSGDRLADRLPSAASFFCP